MPKSTQLLGGGKSKTKGLHIGNQSWVPMRRGRMLCWETVESAFSLGLRTALTGPQALEIPFYRDNSYVYFRELLSG